MSDFQQKDNSGAMFKNNDKTGETEPDYKGNALIDGSDYWINAWLNTSKAGNKYMKFSFSPKEPVIRKAVNQINDTSETNKEWLDDYTKAEKYKEALIKKGIDDLNKAEKYATEQMADKLTETQTKLDQFDDDIPF